MKHSQLAAQLFSVRDFTKDAASLARTLKRIREIGYEAVQVSGIGPVPDKEVASILSGEGLTCCVTHENAQRILDEPAQIVEKLNTLSCIHTAYPHPAAVDLNNPADIHRLAARLNASGKVLAEAGKVLSYHNHDGEFRRMGAGTILDAIYAETAPAYLQGEIDTYWVQSGGQSPVDWCRKLSGRLPLLHIKDMGINADGKQVMREIGNGNLNWKAIISAAEDAGTQWFIVEQDTNWIDGDPLKSLAVSYEYMVETFELEK